MLKSFEYIKLHYYYNTHLRGVKVETEEVGVNCITRSKTLNLSTVLEETFLMEHIYYIFYLPHSHPNMVSY